MWPFKKNRQHSEADEYVRAKRDGRVTGVQTGTVAIGKDIYEGLKCTLVEPGRKVKKGQAIGKR